ncbi:MAG: hypothetical protein IJ304_01800 [Clostridia bacterium]|nr:hypothetical protein [Clostridia bacterium]
MNKLKYSVPGQMLLMIKNHFTVSVVFMIFFLMTASMQKGVFNTLFGVLGFLGYFLSIYAYSGTALRNDKLTVSPLTPKPLKGLLLPAFLTIANVIVILLYKLAWIAGSDGKSMTEIWSLILNIISLLWVAPYQPLLGMAYGHIELQGYLIIFVTPFIASTLGYFAAYKGFDLSAKVHGFAYEKKKDKDKDEF